MPRSKLLRSTLRQRFAIIKRATYMPERFMKSLNSRADLSH
jgi:hypothetical protein